MNEKYLLIGFLTTIGAMVIIIGFGIIAVTYGVKNPSAISVFDAAVTGLTAIALQLLHSKDKGNS